MGNINETSENSMKENFEIVESAIENSQPNDPNRVVSIPSLANYQGAARENLRLRYLFARVILENVPDYEATRNDVEIGYRDGFNYGRRWGGSIRVYRMCFNNRTVLSRHL